MDIDLDTFLVALYTIVDDLYRTHFLPLKPRRPGNSPRLADSEVLTLAVCAQASGPSEREFVGYAYWHWRSYFPKLLSQSQTNRRIRDLAGVMVHLVPLVAAQLDSEMAAYEVLDGLPVPLMRRCRGRQHRLFASEADIGKGGADKDFYYGCQLLLAVKPDGPITGFVLGPASTNIRWMADAFLCWRVDPYAKPWGLEDLPPSNKRTSSNYVGPKGPIWPMEGVGSISGGPYVADDGFGGPVWTDHWAADYKARVLTCEGYRGEGIEAAKERHHRWRHVIETVNGHLEAAFHLLFPLARGRWGLLARVAAKLVAFNLAILINRLFGRPDFAVATLFSK